MALCGATGRLPSGRPALSLGLFVRYRDLAGQPVELHRHDEIVLVQTFDLDLLGFDQAWSSRGPATRRH
jgi:hypothetical protein